MKVVCFHLNQLGDLVFSLPALKSLRDSFPGVSITSVVRPGMKEILQCTGLADEVVPRVGGLNLSKLALAKRLAAEKYDLALVISQSAECAALAFASRAPKRVGFINTSLGGMLTQRIDFSHPPSTRNNERLIEAVGCTVTARTYVGLMQPQAAQIERANKLLRDNGIDHEDRLIAFSPGTSGRRSVKEWSEEGFANVGRHFIDKGYRVLVVGTQPAQGIVQDCEQILDLSCKTNLGELLAVLWRCETVVGVDSGVLHLAAAAGTKVVGLYGPSNFNITGPQGDGHSVVSAGEDCSPCVKTECKLGRKCMTNISADQVIAAVERILTANSSAHS